MEPTPEQIARRQELIARQQAQRAQMAQYIGQSGDGWSADERSINVRGQKYAWNQLQQAYNSAFGGGRFTGTFNDYVQDLLTDGQRANDQFSGNRQYPTYDNTQPPNQGQPFTPKPPAQVPTDGPIPVPKPTPSGPPPSTLPVPPPLNDGYGPNIPPPVSVGGETRNPNLPITPGQGGGGNFPTPGGQGGWPGSAGTLASYGLLGGPNGEILPVMLNQGASPFQQMRQTPQIMGFDPSIPQGVQQMPQFRYQQGLPDYDWYTPPPPPEASPAPPGNADGLPGNNSGGNTGGGTAPPMGPGSGFYRDNINPRQQIKAGLLGGPADAPMGLLGNPYGAALPPALMGLLK